MLQDTASYWNNFWYRPTSTLPLEVFRILFGLLLIQYAMLLFPDFLVWFGHNGIISANTVNNWHPQPRLNLLNFFPDNNIWTIAVFTSFIVASLCLTLGFLTRISSILVFLSLLSFHAHAYLIINSGDNFMRLLAFWLIFSAAGSNLSIDHWLQSRKTDKEDIAAEKLAAPWAQRLMQTNMTLLYAQTFFKKIVGSTWQNGTAVYYSSRMEDFHRFPSDFLFNHLWVCKLLTWATLGIELSLCTLIWIKPLRYYVLALGVLLHLTIDWSMNIPQFEWIMICSYILFIAPADLCNFLKLVDKSISTIKKFKLG
jgi:uncharacterized membrane protein YphA (DoxX/SURF4 family)